MSKITNAIAQIQVYSLTKSEKRIKVRQLKYSELLVLPWWRSG